MDRMQSCLTEIDAFLAVGDIAKAKSLLRRLPLTKISRANLAHFAKTARRCGLPELSLRILSPIVRPKHALLRPANTGEMAEYSAALVRVGAVVEAENILSTLNPGRCPDALLFQCYALMTKWNYRDTIPLLKRFLLVGLPTRDEVLGKLNLAAALVHERDWKEAASLLEHLREKTKSLGWMGLTGSAWELTAQFHYFRGEFGSAQSAVQEAKHLLNASPNLDSFFVKKWEALIEASTSSSSDRFEKTLKVREEAVYRRHWETIRDVDRHLAILQKDAVLWMKVYFGTPSEAFRQRLFLDSGFPLQRTNHYLWKPGPEMESTLDLRSPEFCEFRGINLSLLLALSSDFYRSFTVAHLHNSIHPDQYYNLETSPSRIHQAMSQLRRALKSSKVPLKVDCTGGHYKISEQGRVSIHVSDRSLKTHANPPHWGKILEFAKRGEFNSRELSKFIGISPRTTIRLLGTLNDEGRVIKAGVGKATRYSVKLK